MTFAATLQRYLDEQSFAHQVATHPATGSSSETAQAAHISGDRIAEAVLLSERRRLPARNRAGIAPEPRALNWC